MKTTSKNFLYNIIYQIFILIIPLITTPYISRVLGVNNVGTYAYTYSIVYYFMLFSMLGINNYGSRTIAKCNDDIDDRATKFWNIYFLQLILTTIMIILYIILVILITYDNKSMMIIQGIYLLSVAFDINWLFFGIEKFKITISRNVIIKATSLFLIFFIVKNKNDLWKYTLIMSTSTLISQLYLWIYVKKYIKKSKIQLKEILYHLKPCFILFIPVIAYSIYRVMDKTMLGYFANTFELGNYESAEKIINIPISFITALGTVMIPHMSKIEKNDYNKEIKETFELCFCFILPMAYGLFIISSDFSDIFFGNEFIKTGDIIKLLVPTIIFSAISNVIRTNYLIPKENDKVYVKSTILGAIVNFICNIILIKKYGAYGACIGTVLAELVVMIYQIINTTKNIEYVEILKLFLKYSVKSIFMAIIIYLIGRNISDKLVKIILQIIIGGILYLGLNYKYVLYEFIGLKKSKDKTIAQP